MLVFFDETFRTYLKKDHLALGALCGIAIPEEELTNVANDIFHLKVKRFGYEFASKHEIKGKELLKNYVFKLAKRGIESKNLNLATDILEYIRAKNLKVFGCVCFSKNMQKFACDDVTSLDITFRYIFERIQMFMHTSHQNKMAKLIFDDREFSINKKNSEAITNFFLRSPYGLSMDRLIKTPFFAISQSNNIGLQLADFVTSIVGLRFSAHPEVAPWFAPLKECFFKQQVGSMLVSGLKVIREEKEKRRTVLDPRSGQESPTSGDKNELK